MKKLLLILCLLPSLAIAKDMAYMENAGGGRIVLTNDVCYSSDRKKTFEGMYRIYTYDNRGNTTEGCFTFEETTIRIYWPEHKKEQRFTISSFILIDKN